MTNDKAAKLLHRIVDEQFDGIHGDERREALSMAVRALSGDGDTISRQQAIDALDKHIDTFDAIDTNYLCGLRTAMSILKEMPSAQPETHDKRTETHACDLISRQQAIDIVRNRVKRFTTACVLAVTEIEQLPPAQPERKKGKWINHRNDDGHNIADCDQCGNALQWFDGDEIPRYCCMCGADMRGDTDG